VDQLKGVNKMANQPYPYQQNRFLNSGTPQKNMAVGQLPPHSQLKAQQVPAQSVPTQQVPTQPLPLQQVSPAQTQAIQTANQQQAAFPQATNTTPVNNASNPHQVFIQQALKQGYPPDMIMQFLSNQINLKR
jgi:hypothetical protein